MAHSTDRRSPNVAFGYQATLNGGRVVLVCSLLVLAELAGGCQRGSTWSLVPVEGTVTKDGRPLQGVEVVFLADSDEGTMGPRAAGRTDESGRYRLRTDNGEDGVVVGKYRVLVLAPQVASKSSMERILRGSEGKGTGWLSPEMAQRLEDHRKKMEDAPRVPPCYRLYNETPLRVEVLPGSPVLDLEVK